PPSGLSSAAATAPSGAARTRTFATGVQSTTVTGASTRARLTSQPARKPTGPAGAIGLRATATGSATEPGPLRVEVGVVCHDGGGSGGGVLQADVDHRARHGQTGSDVAETNRTPECRGHTTGRDASDDDRSLDDLAALGGHDGRVDGLEPDEPRPVAGAL